jgi:LysR family glycine cleavage system transcriptional activator
MAGDFEPDPLPPLEWLRVFEAAGRLGNFTAAARELGITQAAVSKRLQNLESKLSTHLFLRLARGVELTVEGEAYLPHVRSALDAMRRGTSDLFGTPRTKVSIAAPASVAALWIAPRLRALSGTYTALQVSVHAIHRPSDFEAIQADYEVRFGRGDWPERESVELYQESLVPSCTTALLESAPGGDWKELPMIAVSGPRGGWREWSAANAEPMLKQPVLRFDSWIAAQHAAFGDAGVFLASVRLAESAFRLGSLVPLTDKRLNMNGGYWLTWPRERTLQSDDEAVISACMSEVSGDT